jgi:hypothetical protein
MSAAGKSHWRQGTPEQTARLEHEHRTSGLCAFVRRAREYQLVVLPSDVSVISDAIEQEAVRIAVNDPRGAWTWKKERADVLDQCERALAIISSPAYAAWAAEPVQDLTAQAIARQEAAEQDRLAWVEARIAILATAETADRLARLRARAEHEFEAQQSTKGNAL